MENNLVVKNQVNTIDSREVAQMTGKKHPHLMRDIKGYKEILDQNPKLDSADFFIESKYEANTGQKYPCYLLTRKGCDMVANKITGEKGVLFTAAYVTKFEEMEKSLTQSPKQITSTEEKSKLADARLKNAKARTASLYLKIANNNFLSIEFRQVLLSYAAKELSGNEILPLPVAERKTYSAKEIGDQLGISSNMVGKIANANNLKTEQYGKFFHDKSKYSSKEVESFRYYENVIPVIKSLLEK